MHIFTTRGSCVPVDYILDAVNVHLHVAFPCVQLLNVMKTKLQQQHTKIFTNPSTTAPSGYVGVLEK